jgi:hypothetical protein
VNNCHAQWTALLRCRPRLDRQSPPAVRLGLCNLPGCPWAGLVPTQQQLRGQVRSKPLPRCLLPASTLPPPPAGLSLIMSPRQLSPRGTALFPPACCWLGPRAPTTAARLLQRCCPCCRRPRAFPLPCRLRLHRCFPLFVLTRAALQLPCRPRCLLPCRRRPPCHPHHRPNGLRLQAQGRRLRVRPAPLGHHLYAHLQGSTLVSTAALLGSSATAVGPQ